jgi:hypothetical protein
VSRDAAGLILGDLAELRRQRRRHFVPALALALLVLGGFLLLTGLRPDLLHQPAWQLALQLATWLLCLVALPAIGLGLWFPGRWVRVAVALAAVGAAIGAALGPGLMDMVHGTGPDGQALSLDYCMQATFLQGGLLFAVGVISGAFVARVGRGGALWLSGGIALMALDAVVWHCPSQDLSHNLQSHLGAAVLLLVVAAVGGLIVHRRRAP